MLAGSVPLNVPAVAITHNAISCNSLIDMRGKVLGTGFDFMVAIEFYLTNPSEVRAYDGFRHCVII